VVTALAVLFSALSTPVLSALYTLGFYCVGQWSWDLREFARQAPASLGAALHVVATWCRLRSSTCVRSAAHGELTTPFHLGIATLYALLYCACALALATAAFESRDFK